jgi:hypothetical protein
MAKASASYTIMDYTDGVTLLGTIEANLPRTVLYDTTTQKFNPSWATTALQLTPKITKAGSATDLVSSLKSSDWYRRVSGGSWVKVTSGSNNETISGSKVLSVNANKMISDIWQIEYKFVCVYTDPILNLDLDYEMVITFSRVANGTSFVIARAYAPGGDMFKNSEPASITIKGELLRGATEDITNLSYVWKKSTNGSSWSSVSGATTAELTVTPAMVDSFAMFRVEIKDTDAASDTYNQTFISEGVTILDVSDPYQVVIQSSAGQFFKNNTGSTVLTARVYRDGTEVDVGGTGLTYSWTMTDKDGDNVSTAGSTSFPKSGKDLTVTHDMVTVKGTFFCEIS